MTRRKKVLVIAGVHPQDQFVKSLDDLPGADRKFQRLPVCGGVKHAAVVQPPGVMHLHRIPALCLRHAGCLSAARGGRPFFALRGESVETGKMS